jgi:hypothetical protein
MESRSIIFEFNSSGLLLTFFQKDNSKSQNKSKEMNWNQGATELENVKAVFLSENGYTKKFKISRPI